MNNLIIYSLEVAVSIALLYSVYWMFLKNETYFKLNRFYLVTSVVFSLLLPLLSISIENNSFLTTALINPIERYEHELVGSRFNKKHQTIYLDDQNKATITPVQSVEETNNELNASQGKATDQKNTNTPINWINLIVLIYFIGVGLFLIRFLANLIWIYSFVLKNKSQQIQNIRVIRAEGAISPFSFLHFIVIGQTEYQDEELKRIISHEKVHIRQRHSLDLILFELLLVFQWFNPFVWFSKRAIKITHEYLADEGTINEGVDLPAYQYSLLNQALGEHDFKLTSTYNLSIKKRIAMMMQKRSSKLSVLKLAIALPILLVIFSAFAFNTEEPITRKSEAVAAVSDTSIKVVNVPLEYLKLLEGEYISTNEPNRDRHIIFTELLGHLYGLDNNYTYKILPIGSETFINPDDKATLVFNSSDKQAISMVLFGSINLKKRYIAKGSKDVQNRSMAFTMANVMLKKGVEAGLSFYKAAKDSTNYYTSEDQINYVGYMLWQEKKLKEAEAMFKLNTELFPNSYNPYDSYAELLLEKGDKSLAIENYKKSVKLNPGSKNGLQRLKELGVNADNLVKPIAVSIEYLKLIEGDYLSTNEKNWVRWIRFTVENGVLYGNDNNYRYRLIPMGDGKFINPDDGASLVFDTKNREAISLLLFGKVNLQKTKTIDAADVDLNKYAGLYLPLKEDVLQKPTRMIIENNKLYRRIESDPEGPNKTIELIPVSENIFFYGDHSGRSLQFIVNDKNTVTEGKLRRPDGVYRLIKQ